MKWSALNHLQLGKYAEHMVKMEFTKMAGVSVFATDVDDRGIDFIIRIRKNSAVKYFEVQCKAIRKPNTGYIFVTHKSVEEAGNFFFVVVAVFKDDLEPDIFLFPLSKAMKNQNKWVYRKYGENNKSDPEFGLSVKKDYQDDFKEFRLNKEQLMKYLDKARKG